MQFLPLSFLAQSWDQGNQNHESVTLHQGLAVHVNGAFRIHFHGAA